MNYYNEYDKHAASWLRELIAAGLIPAGHVDERSIVAVQPAELAGFTQCHFFAGIGGWSLALQLAGWDSSRPVWSGSCPCQPYSVAGKQEGNADARDLWPAFARLIRECKPATVFGEQVEGAVRHGWLDRVCGDLEAEGYACGSAVLGAHSVGAPHIRQRLFWLADLSGAGSQRSELEPEGQQYQAAQRGGAADGLADAIQPGQCGGDERGSGTSGQQMEEQEHRQDLANESGDGREDAGGLGNAQLHGRLADPIRRSSGQGERESWLLQCEGSDPYFWSDCDIIQCRDGKARRVESGVFPLAHGVPGRVGLLRGYGNAIVPQVAAEFVKAFMGIQ